MPALAPALVTRAATARGIACLGLSAVLFGGMSLLTKLAGARVPGPEIAAVRFALGLVLTLLLAGAGVVTVRAPRPHLPLLLVRGFCGGVAVILFFTAITHGNVGTATLLNFTSPVFTALFAWLFLRERLSPWVGCAFALAGGGVTLVWRGTHAGQVSLLGWQSLGLLSAVLAGAAVTAIRGLRRREAVSAWTVFLFFNAAGLACSAPVAAAGFVWPGAREWGLLLALSALSIAGQLLFTWSLAWVQAAVSGIIQQVTVVVAFALGGVVLHEPLGGLQFLGAGLTMAGAAWAARLIRPGAVD
ncbi:MAG: DMT family transporter [Deltaproteobacteria bacterium]|nr:DMT family transporter [Deltaproteobacteria bacterium]